MNDIERLTKLLTKHGVLFDKVQRCNKPPFWVGKKVNYVLRLSSRKTDKHERFYGLDWFAQGENIKKALKSSKAISVEGLTHKDYIGRPGYWGARRSWTPASIDHWTLSVYLYWKGK